MATCKLKKSQTLEDIVQEIRTLQGMIRDHQKGKLSGLSPFSYPEALKRLKYLRVRQSQIKRK